MKLATLIEIRRRVSPVYRGLRGQARAAAFLSEAE
jgi:hypothetical protein